MKMNRVWQSGSNRLLRASVTGLLVCLLSDCHSAFVAASITNHTGGAIRLLEVDYPSASFGTQDLANGAEFHYRFKLIGNGPVKLSWTDAAQKDHDSVGPTLTEGQEGKLSVTVGPKRAVWQSELRP